MLKTRVFTRRTSTTLIGGWRIQNDRKQKMSLRVLALTRRSSALREFSSFKRNNLISNAVIARRSRSNPIFNLYFLTFFILLLVTCYSLLATSLSFAQQTYNLEVIFKRTNWEPDSVLSYGYSLSSAGDLNQDGFDDIIYLTIYDSWVVKGYIYYGGSPMDTFPDLVLKGEAGAQGQVCSGDLNGDSVSDIIIGQPAGSGGYGLVQIYFGGTGMDSLPDLKIRGEVNADAFGCAVTCGDINGDSFDDLIVGAYAYNGFTLNGRVYVYYGGPLLDTIPDVIINGHNSEAFGKSIGSGGDVNSDDFEDIVVGADENSEAYPGAGKVYVFLGGDPMDTIPDCWLHGEGATHYLGWCPVDIVRNELTFDHTLTGTPFYPYGFPSYAPGKLYVLFGGSPMDSLVDWYKHGEDDSSSLGMASSFGGFESSDVFGEFIGGAPIGAMRYGKGSVWLGDLPFDSLEDANIIGNMPIEVGWVVASAGDVQGDGYDEVMFSNYAADSNQTVWVCRYTGPGIEETAGRSTPYAGRFTVYPNPFSNKLRIAYIVNRNAKDIDLKIYDVTGREVVFYESKKEEVGSKKYKEGMIRIDTKDLPSGVYFIKVEAGGFCTIRKVVKIR